MSLLKNKKALAMSVLCAIASVGFVVSASAEETMHGSLDEVVVEGEANTLPGGFISETAKVGVFGNEDILDTPFTQNIYTQKTIEMFEDPNQPLNGVLANNPSVRIGSASTMYTDFKMRGITMNANHYTLNGIPSLFNQSLSLPVYTLDSVELVSGPNTVLNGSTNSTNGTNGTDAAPGLLSATTKKASSSPVNSYKQIFSGRSNLTEQIDIARRFGDNDEWGIRVMGRHQDGGTAIKGAETKDKSIYINLDHKDDKSKSNLFIGNFDGGTIGGQRWFASSKLTHSLSAPDLSKNFSYDGQKKLYNGYLITFNHEQQLNEDWSAFFNIGGNRYQEEKYDMMSGSPDLYDDGHFEKDLRHYKSHITSIYYQGGIRCNVQIGSVKNNLVLAVDRENYKSYSHNSKGGKLIGDLWNGVTSVGSIPGDFSVYDGSAINENVVSMVLADKIEYGKWIGYVAGQYRNSDYNTFKAGKPNQSISNTSFNPTYSIAYKPTDDMSIYASYATSYTRPFLVSGGYLNDGEVFDPIKNKQTEIGVKYKSGKFLNTLSYFDLSQGSYIKESIDKGDIYTQDGENKFRGVEWTFTGNIDRKWNVMGGLTYMDTKRECTVANQKDGWRVVGAPKLNGVIAAEYQPDEKTSLIGRINFTDRTLINDNGVETPSYTLIDFGVKHKTQINNVPVVLSAMCYNVFDKNYFYGDDLGAPRTFMLSAQFDI